MPSTIGDGIRIGFGLMLAVVILLLGVCAGCVVLIGGMSTGVAP